MRSKLTEKRWNKRENRLSYWRDSDSVQLIYPSNLLRFRRLKCKICASHKPETPQKCYERGVKEAEVEQRSLSYGETDQESIWVCLAFAIDCCEWSRVWAMMMFCDVIIFSLLWLVDVSSLVWWVWEHDTFRSVSFAIYFPAKSKFHKWETKTSCLKFINHLYTAQPGLSFSLLCRKKQTKVSEVFRVMLFKDPPKW